VRVRGVDGTKTTATKTQFENPLPSSSRLHTTTTTTANNTSISSINRSASSTNSTSSRRSLKSSSSPSSRFFLKGGEKREGLSRSLEQEKPLVGKTDMIRFSKEIDRLQQRLSEERSVAFANASRRSPEY